VYVRGVVDVVIAARVSRVRSWSLCCWVGDSGGRVADRAVIC
jgi:hypothetical protein